MSPQICAHPGMITSDEEDLILDLISKVGDVDESRFIEIGPWLGKSSYCILDAIDSLNPGFSLSDPKLLCIDRFRWSSMYAVASKDFSDFMSYYSLDKLSEGDCFQLAFDKIMADHVSNIPVKSLKKEVFDIDLNDIISFAGGESISVFFIDASKNWEDNYSLLDCISKYAKESSNEFIVYLQDAFHPTAYRLLNLLVLCEGLDWHSYSLRTGTALVVRVSSDFRLPSRVMNEFDVSHLFSSWSDFREFMVDHHLFKMNTLALASFLFFTGHSDAGRSIASEILGGMNPQEAQLFEKLAGTKVVRQYKFHNLI